MKAILEGGYVHDRDGDEYTGPDRGTVAEVAARQSQA